MGARAFLSAKPIIMPMTRVLPKTIVQAMLIDNKVDRYPEDGLGIKTVWDFISLYSGHQSGQTGKLDIVTGYFTIRALSKLYRELPAEDEFRIVSSEMVREEKQLE